MGKMSWWGNIESHLFAGYQIFVPAGIIERYIQGSIFRFHETEKDDPIMTSTNLSGNIINIHPFGDGYGKKLSLDFSSYFHANEMLSIPSNFKLLP